MECPWWQDPHQTPGMGSSQPPLPCFGRSSAPQPCTWLTQASVCAEGARMAVRGQGLDPGRGKKAGAPGHPGGRRGSLTEAAQGTRGRGRGALQGFPAPAQPEAEHSEESVARNGSAPKQRQGSVQRSTERGAAHPGGEDNIRTEGGQAAPTRGYTNASIKHGQKLNVIHLTKPRKYFKSVPTL